MKVAVMYSLLSSELLSTFCSDVGLLLEAVGTNTLSPEETPGSRIRLDLLFEQLKGLFVSSQFLNVHFRLFLLSTDLFFLLTLGLSLLLSQTFLFGLHLALLEIVRHKNDGKIRGRVVSTSHDPN
ncbi:hypothetical protein B0I72DRAFT_177079 [Yarrowia lipolytica]|nr:hypothetical protein B0I72DRAFT_177079 [Yarrowia lipolytica]RDW36368.1 hypothetical protein B0I73DRAFT_171951 [Yarrowia lipolytica]RDW47830.1 hypothetical protein B0I74DRAFT_172258 [Yarrowia lipolytica]RDW55063.1 hypothetical protein B0I75DRAFT_156337 [Yarrowia lipolytica]